VNDSLDLDKKFVALSIQNSDRFSAAIEDIKGNTHLQPPYREMFNYIVTSFKKHKKLPPPEILEKKLLDQKDKIFGSTSTNSGGLILDLLTASASLPEESYPFIVEELRDRYAQKIMHDTVKEAIHLVKTAPRECVDLFQKAIAKVKSETEKSISKHTNSHEVTEWLQESYAKAKENPESSWGYRTGFKKLDNATFGLKAGEMAVVAARHGNGKSMWLLSACINMYKAGQNVALISLEMPYEQYWMRFMACLADIPTKDVIAGNLSPEHLRRYNIALKEMETRKNRFTIIDMPHTTVESISAEIATIAVEYRPDVLAVDYLGIVRSSVKGLKDHEAQASVVEELRAFSRALEVPILTAVQLNRDPGKGKQKTKGTERLSRSDTVGATADLVIQIEEVDPEEAMLRQSDKTKIHVIKNRKGEAPFDFEVRKNFAHAKFEDWDPLQGWIDE